MEFFFSKYTGCGNDFILIDDRKETFPLEKPFLIKKICDRKKGIGADGIILLQESEKAHYRMRIFNPDASEAEMCGNGIRCLMQFLQEKGLVESSCNIETLHRVHRVALNGEDVSVEMGEPRDVEWDINLNLSCGDAYVHHLNTGVPHAIEFVEDVEKVEILKRGSDVRHHSFFSPKGANYSAVQITEEGHLFIRTFERGVEEETGACGTGATAAALAAARKKDLKSPIQVRTQSGEALKIHFEMTPGSPKDVWMAGPAKKIYSGVSNLSAFF